MNALEYAEMSIGEPVSNLELFKFVGRNDASQAIEESRQSLLNEPDDLKTTSVRLSEKKLLVLDAVMSKFGDVRTEEGNVFEIVCRQAAGKEDGWTSAN